MGISTELHKTSILDERITLSLIMGLSIPGLCVSFLVLCAFAYTAYNPKSRDHLNRVSFRLLAYALTANITFGFSVLIGTVASGPNAGCTFDAFIGNFGLMFSAGMFFCMALNLQLVLVHKINGHKMEKFYVFGTLLLALACNVTPYVAGQWGWNSENETCWFIASTPTHTLHWLLGTQSVWILLMAIGEVFAFLVIVGYVLSYEITTRNFRVYSGESYEEDQPVRGPQSPIMVYRGMILRIALYPIVSCLMNFSTAILDIYGVKNPILTELNWRLSIADLAIYSLRPFFYSVLAATDPSFIRAVQSLREPNADSEGSRGMQQTPGIISGVQFLVPDDLEEFDTVMNDGDSDATQAQTQVITPRTGAQSASESKRSRGRAYSEPDSGERNGVLTMERLQHAKRKDAVDDLTRQI